MKPDAYLLKLQAMEDMAMPVLQVPENFPPHRVVPLFSGEHIAEALKPIVALLDGCHGRLPPDNIVVFTVDGSAHLTVGDLRRVAALLEGMQ